jgi:hypothetical protein
MNGCNRYREWHHSACRSAKCLIKRESRLEETVDTQRYKVFPQSWLVRWECAARTLGRRLAAAGLATSWTLQFWNPCEIGEIKSGKELSRETPLLELAALERWLRREEARCVFIYVPRYISVRISMQDTESLILQLLRSRPMTSEDIARQPEISWSTANGYLLKLAGEGKPTLTRRHLSA